MLGKVAKWLRLFGYDTYYSNSAEDRELSGIALTQQRFLLTKDSGLASANPGICYFVKATAPGGQILEIRDRFQLRFFSSPPRCSLCNSLLVTVSPLEVRELVPCFVWQTQSDFTFCVSCRKVYWKGTHWEKLVRRFDSGET